MRGRAGPALLRLALAVATLAAACGGGSAQSTSEPPNTVHILAGSELKDVEPLLPDIRARTGINLVLDYVGTLDGAEQIAGGQAGNHAMAWYSSTRYLSLLPGGASKIVAQQRIALSPVVLGVKRSKARALGWEGSTTVTWSDVADAAGSGKLSFGMTN
ncbi:MAG TPA: hypothetical protein VFO60_04835, partial [Candidatus Dormibacteraeota bacterium]|nr:hypothetical protein [Candidatus Dormibacteraeota bacterium]